jgi:hypothetical protein
LKPPEQRARSAPAAARRAQSSKHGAGFIR